METNGHKRIVLARWRGMAIHCNYCKKEGHKIADCAKLAARKERQQQRKLCYICQSPEHLKANCPRSQQPRAGEKRARTEESLVDPRTVPAEESVSTQTSTPATDVQMEDTPATTSTSSSSQHPYGFRPRDDVNYAELDVDQDDDDELDKDASMDLADQPEAFHSRSDQDHTDGGGSSSSTPPNRL